MQNRKNNIERDRFFAQGAVVFETSKPFEFCITDQPDLALAEL